MKKSVLHFFSTIRFGACLFALLFLPSVSYASSPPANNVHVCEVLDYEDMGARDSLYAAAKQALNVGEPRTVRMIYFLPNDRPFQQAVVESMKVTIRQIQTFYAEQMEAHGYGRKTLRFETDAQGDPVVHRVDGQHPDSQYLDDTVDTVFNEIGQAFDARQNIYFIVVDNSTNRIGQAAGSARLMGKNGGVCFVPGRISLGQRRPMNSDTLLICVTISEMRLILCLMEKADEALYLRAMRNFCPCIPISIPIYQLKRRSHQPSNSFRRLDIQPVQRAFLSNSKSAIRMGCIK